MCTRVEDKMRKEGASGGPEGVVAGPRRCGTEREIRSLRLAIAYMERMWSTVAKVLNLITPASVLAGGIYLSYTLALVPATTCYAKPCKPLVPSIVHALSIVYVPPGAPCPSSSSFRNPAAARPARRGATTPDARLCADRRRWPGGPQKCPAPCRCAAARRP